MIPTRERAHSGQRSLSRTLAFALLLTFATTPAIGAETEPAGRTHALAMPAVADTTPPSLPVAVLADRELRARAHLPLVRALESVSGVRAVSAGDRLGRLLVRGLGDPRVLVLDGESPVYDLPVGDLDGVSIDVRQADCFEVIRGPQSLRYGMNAISGVVKAIQEAPGAGVAEGRRWSGGAESYGTSGENGAGGRLRVEGVTGLVGWRLSGVGRHADDLSTSWGPRGSSGFDELNGEAAIGIRSRLGEGTIRYARFGGHFDRPAGAGDSGEEVTYRLRRSLDDRRLQWSGRSIVSGTELAMRGQWQRRDLDVSGEFARPFSSRLDAYTLRLDGRRASGRWTTTLGGAGSLQTTETKPSATPLPDAHLTTGGMFAIEELNGDRWSITGGMRLDLHHVEAHDSPALALPAQSRGMNAWSGGVGGSFHPTDAWTLRANVGRAWRPPTLLESYARGPLPGHDQEERGARDLGPERGLGLDAGAGWRAGRWAVGVDAFRTRIDDFIVLEPGEVLGGRRVFRYAAREAAVVGGECLAAMRVSSWLALDGRLDYVSGEDPTLGTPLSSMPPPRWVASASVHRRPGALAADDGWVRLEIEGQGRRTRLGRLDSELDPFTLIGLDAELAWEPGGRVVRAGARIDNITNALYFDAISAIDVSTIGPGRSLTLRVSSEW